MNKKVGKILALSILGLFALSILAAVVMAANEKTSLLQDIGSGISKITNSQVSIDFSWLSKGLYIESDTGIMIARILIFLLITLIVYSLGDFLPFVGDRPFINFVISVIIGALSAFFLRPADVEAAIFTYPVLGILIDFQSNN